ncbi:polar amino acid transport system permease protein [Sinomonas atrocyanea]|uniref:amino acid ABC transporter permease n=1 Tax=Sinomonas atrocyanea TaxID=37927 RepID=UPI0027829CD7|nr:amino acid ABC transporter permease [Sinomonas atrocyanea]MDP9883894.1 polar amino acid transport system permease protein [Sinomonas atrocyanea]
MSTISDTRKAAEAPEEIRMAHRAHWGWWVLTAFVVVFAAGIVQMLFTNPNLEWDVVADWFFSQSIIFGLLRTLELTVLSMLFGILLGMLTAVMRLSPIRILSSVAWFYTWFFRGTPLLVQLIFWYNLAALFPRIGIGVPLGGPTFWSANANQIVTPFMAALLGLALNEGAYMAEIVRGGILSVDQGQQEAAVALGMRSTRAMRRVILPQAMRVIVPPTGNQVIGMLKSTSLVSVTSMPELLYSAQLVYNRTFQTIPLLIVASIWYLIVTSVLSLIQYYIERHYAKGGRRALPPTPWEKLRRTIAKFLPAQTATSTRRA